MKRLFELTFTVALIALLAGPVSAAPACAPDHQIINVIKNNRAEGWKIVRLTEPQRAVVEDAYNKVDPPTNEHFDAIYVATRADMVDNEGKPMVLIVLVQNGCFVGASPVRAQTLENILGTHQS